MEIAELPYLDELFDDPYLGDSVKRQIAWVIAKERGIKRTTFRDRLKRKWDLYEACMGDVRKTNGKGKEEKTENPYTKWKIDRP